MFGSATPEHTQSYRIREIDIERGFGPDSGEAARTGAGRREMALKRLRAEIIAIERAFPDGDLRHAAFLGLRTDKTAREIRREP